MHKTILKGVKKNLYQKSRKAMEKWSRKEKRKLNKREMLNQRTFYSVTILIIMLGKNSIISIN